jgi:hypothetical protein
MHVSAMWCFCPEAIYLFFISPKEQFNIRNTRGPGKKTKRATILVLLLRVYSLPSNDRGKVGIDARTDTQQGDVISLLLVLKNEESRVMKTDLLEIARIELARV